MENIIIKTYIKKIKLLAKTLRDKTLVDKLEQYIHGDIEQFMMDLKRLGLFCCEYSDVNLQAPLTKCIIDIYQLNHDEVFKDRRTKEHLNTVKQVKTLYNELCESFSLRSSAELLKEDKKLHAVIYDASNIYYRNEFAIFTINQYVNQIVSKTIDYLPTSIANDEKVLNEILDKYDNIKLMLNYFVENGLLQYVYPFTLSYKYIPISLRFLNQFDSLGDAILKWNEGAWTNPLVNALNDRGYDVFAGWGYLGQSESSSVEDVPVVQETKPTLPKQLEDKIMGYLIRLLPMFIRNKRVLMTNRYHREVVCRTLTLPFMLAAHKYDVKIGKVIEMIDAVRNKYRKVASLKGRKDRRYWLTREDALFIKDILDKQVNEDRRYEYYATDAIMHVFDYITEETGKRIDATNILHGVLARSYNAIYYSAETKPTNEYLGSLFSMYRHLQNTYMTMVDDEFVHLYDAASEFWLNIRNNDRVVKLHQAMKEWLGKRRTRLENDVWHDEVYPLIKLLSYHNKKAFLELIEKEPIENVNYAGSQEIYEEFITIIKNDINNPITDGRANNHTDDKNDPIGLEL